jgi:hypothetical protein
MARSRRTKKPPAKTRDAAPLIDPRRGDIEDDASSTKARSMLSLAGSLLVEISLPKLIFAWTVLLLLPGLLLGFIPMVFAEWLKIVTDKLTSLVLGVWSILALAGLLALAWFGWRDLFRVIEKSFWALNSIVVEPGYASFREAFRQLAERLFARDASDARRGRLRAAAAAIAGPHLRLRRARDLDGVASHPPLRQSRRNRLVEDRDRRGSRQQRGRHLRLSRRGRSHLGLRRRHHAAAPHACAFRQSRSQEPHVADRPSLRHSRGGRTPWPPHRERAIGSERQPEA